jgi:hypothetical protein
MFGCHKLRGSLVRSASLSLNDLLSLVVICSLLLHEFEQISYIDLWHHITMTHAAGDLSVWTDLGKDEPGMTLQRKYHEGRHHDMTDRKALAQAIADEFLDNQVER